MTLNEVLIRQNFISKLLIKNENVEIDKDLKVKIMMMRVELTRYKTQFDNACLEKIKELQTEEFGKLSSSKDLNKEQTTRLDELTSQLKEEYNNFLVEKGKEDVDFDKKFTEEEYAQLIDVNSSNDIDINGTTLDALSFLEVIYALFVE